MLLVRIIKRAAEIVNPIVKWVNSVGMVVLALMMFLTAVDVALRYTINKPIVGSYEVTAYMMVVFISFAIAQTGVERGHVNVDMVTQHIPKKPRTILLTVTNFICVILFFLIAWRSFVHASKTLESGAVSPALSVPEFPFVIVTGIGFVLLTVVFLIQFLESIAEAMGKWNQS